MTIVEIQRSVALPQKPTHCAGFRPSRLLKHILTKADRNSHSQARKGEIVHYSHRCAAAILPALWAVLSANSPVLGSDVYKIASYPVQGVAKDAVTAKSQALAEGQRRAFHSLMKRIVPVTSYQRLPRLKLQRIADMLDGFAVRSERNSATEYLASLDFRFKRPAVLQLLQSYGIAVVDLQAPKVTLVPVFIAAPDGPTKGPFAQTQGSRDWATAWQELDIANSVSPLAVVPFKRVIRTQVVSALVQGDDAKLRILQDEYGARMLVLAVAEPRNDGKRLNIALIGVDAVGPFRLHRSLPIDQGDVAFTAELAAVIGLGVIEGRWKAINTSQSSVGSSPSDLVEQRLNFTVVFHGIGEWQKIRQQLTQIPGVSGLDTGTVSARGAEVALNYPGGIAAFQNGIAAQGLRLNNLGGVWVLQRL